MKKSLQIEGNPALLSLAEFALFERVQDIFNLHPGPLAQHVERLVAEEKVGMPTTVERLRTLVLLEFDYVFSLVEQTLEGKSVNLGVGTRLYASQIRTSLNIDPRVMVRDYPKKARHVGLDVQVLTRSLREMAPPVIEWTFDEILRILERRGIK